MPEASGVSKRSAGGKSARKAALDAAPGKRISPHTIEAEQAVLACCMQEGGADTLPRCIEAKLTHESFYKPAHQSIFRAMMELSNEQVPIDEITLGEKLNTLGELEAVGGYAYLTEVAERIDTTAHLQHYINRVRDTSLLRALIRTCQDTVERAFLQEEKVDHFLNDVEQEVFRLSEDSLNESTLSNAPQMMESAGRQIAFLLQNRGEVSGITSGFVDLDKLTTGFHAPQMVVVAARPGMGKTSIALNMAEAAITGNGDPAKVVPTLMFSLEMGADELALRLVCSHARVSARKLRDGFIPGEMQKELNESIKALGQAPFFVDDSSGLNIHQMRAKARRMKSQHKVGLVIVDYLQLLSGTDPSVPRHEQIAEISRGIKGMAKELRIPVIALAQLNRETEKERRAPRMSDLRESGAIEQDADIVLLISQKLSKDEQNDESGNVVPRDLIIAKQRNGPTGSIALTFNKSITRFENAAKSF